MPELKEILASIADANGALPAALLEQLRALPPDERAIAEKIAGLKTEVEKRKSAGDTLAASLNNLRGDFERAIFLLSAFTRLSDLLNTNSNPAELPRRAVEIFIDWFRFEQCSIMLYDEGNDLLVHAAGAGQLDYFDMLDGKQSLKRGISMKPGAGAAGTAATTRRPVIINDVAADEMFFKHDNGPWRGSVACLPMVHQGRLIGVVNFSHSAAGYFDDNTVRALLPMVSIIGQVLELAKAQRELGNVNISLEKLVADKTAELEKSAAKLQNANRLKDDFLANIGHELRTPLTSIIGFSRLLIDFHQMEDEERLSYLKIILERGQSLEMLLDDLLDLARIESGNMPMNVERMNMGELVTQCVEHFRLMAEGSGLHLNAHLDHRPLLCYADPPKLMQVLNNLIHNAIKYTAEGGAIEVLAKQLPHEIMVSIIDTGVGIETDQHEVIFERFRQAENRRNKAGGAGIGLNLAKQIIEMHSGKIWVESTPGKGSTFSFVIPTELLCDLQKEKKVAPLFAR